MDSTAQPIAPHLLAERISVRTVSKYEPVISAHTTMDILFWSGGKDAYLAHEFYRRDRDDAGLKLLTTYDKESGIVPHQDIPIGRIREQAERLERDLLPVGLPPDCPNDRYLKTVGAALEETGEEIEHLIFGDWKLEDVRMWREQRFNEMGYRCLFPIWNESLHDLLPVLLLQPVRVTVSAVDEPYRQYIRVGEEYNQRFVRTLPKEIDPMGENGEFHTEVTFIDLKKKVV